MEKSTSSAPFYRSHAQMRLSIYNDLRGIDAVAFPLDGGVGALLDVSKLNARFKDRDLVEDRVLELMKVARKHHTSFQPFLVIDAKNGKRNLYALGRDGKTWALDQSRFDQVISAADNGERL